jgi:hypothetical protein
MLVTPLVQQLADLGVVTHLVTPRAGPAQRAGGPLVRSSQQESSIFAVRASRLK